MPRPAHRGASSGMLGVMVGWALTVSAFVVSAHPARATTPQVGIYFDQEGIYCNKWDLQPFVLFDFYVLGFHPDTDLGSYEFGVTGFFALVITVREFAPTPGGIDLGVGSDNWIVDASATCLVASARTPLVHYRGVYLSAVSDQWLCLAAAEPSRLTPPYPAYTVCSAPGTPRPFRDAYGNWCALVNPGPLSWWIPRGSPCERPSPTSEESWGAVKLRFEG